MLNGNPKFNSVERKGIAREGIRSLIMAKKAERDGDPEFANVCYKNAEYNLKRSKKMI